MKPVKKFSAVASVIWLAIVFLWSFTTLQGLLRSGRGAGSSLVDLPRDIHDGMLACCWRKNALVALNGGWTRLLGKRLCNGVYRLNGQGRLFGDSPSLLSAGEVERRGMSLARLRNYIGSWGGRLLYVQPPYGIDLGKTMLPYGALPGRVHGDENADRIIGVCRREGVPVLDMRTFMSATPEQVDSSFYRTDHHWRIESVFKAFPEILAAMRGLSVVGDEIRWDESKWKYVFHPGFFLGYWGRKTGCLFSGFDDFGYYETDTGDMSMSVPSLHYFKKGPFNDVVIFRKHLGGGTSTANRNAVYIGENVPLAVIRNPSAAAGKKVLVLKDSFARPIIAFLSTVFKEVHAIDPRLFKTDISEYAAAVRPDCVLVCYNPVSVSNKNSYWFDFGKFRPAPNQDGGEIVAENIEVDVSAVKNQWAWESLPVQFAPNSWYRITFKIDASPKVAGVSVRLYDTVSQKYVNTAMFSNEGPAAVIDWMFHIGENNAQLVLYAGIAGKTAGNKIRYFDVSIEKFASGKTNPALLPF